MQWETKTTFNGQVKPAGCKHNMSWKLGSVDFDYDSGSNSWLAKLYFKVNPNRAAHQMKIGQSDQLDVKCGRLMIENKKGDGIHIKLANNDLQDANLLVSKIKDTVRSTPKHSNRAEVGLMQNGTMSQKKGSENISPYDGSGSFSSDISPVTASADLSLANTGTWLSKKTPPTRYKESNMNPPSKRKLALPSPEKSRCGPFEDEWDDDVSQTPSRFTGMKDYSKRSYHSINTLSLANAGLGTKSFYGAENSLINDNNYRGLERTNRGRYNNSNNNNQGSGGIPRSPLLKKPRLSTSVESKGNRMASPGGAAAAAAAGEGPAIQADQLNRYGDGQTIGFQNLGNTCFLNSPLQCLSSLEPFSLDIQSVVAQYGPLFDSGTVTRMLYLLMKDVRKLDVSQERVKEVLIQLRRGMNKFELDTQQDAHELLNELLDRVDIEGKRVLRKHEGGDSITPSAAALLSFANPVTPTEVNFNWFYKRSIYFHECKTEVTSDTADMETNLILAIDSQTFNIQDCIDKYFQSAEVDVTCERCGKPEKATMTRRIVRRPRIFIINLLRYQTNGKYSQKRQDSIEIPTHITIADFCADDVKAPKPILPEFMLEREKSNPVNDDDSDDNNNKKDNDNNRNKRRDNNRDKNGDSDDDSDENDNGGLRNGTARVQSAKPRSSQAEGKRRDPEKTIKRKLTRSKGNFQTPVGQLDEFTLPPDSSKSTAKERPHYYVGSDAFKYGLFGWRKVFDKDKSSEDQNVPKASNLEKEESLKETPTSLQDGSQLEQSEEDFMQKHYHKKVVDIITNEMQKSSASALGPLLPIISVDTEESEHMNLSQNPSSAMNAFGQDKTGDLSSAVLGLDTAYSSSFSHLLKDAVDASDAGLKTDFPEVFVDDGLQLACEEVITCVDELPEGANLQDNSDCNSNMLELPKVGVSPDNPKAKNQGGAVAATSTSGTLPNTGDEHYKEMQHSKEMRAKETDNGAASDTNNRETSSKVAEESTTEEADETAQPASRLNLVRRLNECFDDVNQFMELANTECTNVDALQQVTSGIIDETRTFVEATLKETQNNGADKGDKSQHSYEDILMSLQFSLLVRTVQSWTRDGNLPDGIEDSDLSPVIKEIVSTRYAHIVSGTKRSEHFVEELGLYLAAKYLGIVNVVLLPSSKSGKIKASESESDSLPLGAEAASVCNIRAADGVIGEGCISVRSSGTHVPKKVTFRETDNSDATAKDNCGDGSGVKPEDPKNCSTPQKAAGEAAVPQPHFGREFSWEDEYEPNNLGPYKISDDFAMNFEDLRGEQILGREVVTYSREELMSIDPAVLTFEEQMTHVKAVSTLEFLDAAKKHAQDEIDGELAMDLCESTNSAGAVANDGVQVIENGTVSEAVSCPNSSSDMNHTSNAIANHTALRKAPDVVPVLTPPSSTTSPEPADNKDPFSHVTEPVETTDRHKLFCDEDLSDLDEATVPGCSENSDTNSRSPLLLSGQEDNSSRMSTLPPLTIADTNNCMPQELCANCGSEFYGECTYCLDQTDFGSQPLDTRFTIPESSSLFCNTDQDQSTTVLSSSTTMVNKCNTTSNDQAPSDSIMVSPVPNLGEKSSSSSSESATDHVVPGSPFPSPRKDPFLMSPTKVSKSVRSGGTRDYNRLRSPSASPKKRTNKAAPPRAQSATKRLQFPEGEKCSKTHLGVSEDPASEARDMDCTNSDSELVHSVSIEVNVDDVSFLGHIDSCAVSPSAVRAPAGSPSTPPSSTSNLAQSHNSCLFSPSTKTSSTLTSSVRPIPLDITASLPPVNTSSSLDTSRIREEPNAQQMSPLSTSLPATDKGPDLAESTALRGRAQQVSFNESSSENIMPDKAANLPTKSKTHRSLLDSFSDAEEKENKPEDQARRRRIDNIENGEADLSYRLVGVVNHIGDSLYAGHYTAFAFNLSRQRWYYMNDNITKETTQQAAQRESLKTGYVLFYMDKELFQQYQAKASGTSV